MSAKLNMYMETDRAWTLLQAFSPPSVMSACGLGVFCFYADSILLLPVLQQRMWLRAAADNLVHGIIGLWSWVIVVRMRKRSDLGEVALAGFLASVIDLDHFCAAGSFSLKAALHLPRRPPLHCSSLIPVLCFALRLLTWACRLRDPWCSLPWMLFLSLASHHVRDGLRHGLWVWPFGSTPPVPHWLYVAICATQPHLCSILMHVTEARDTSTQRDVTIDV